VLAKLVSVVAGLVTVPITISYLGPERWGLWATLTSIVSMFTFADLGLGNGLLNQLSTAFGRDDDERVRRLVNNAVWMLSVIALTLLVIFAVVAPHVPWYRLFNLDSTRARSEVFPALLVLWLVFTVGLPLATVEKIQLARQRGYISGVWQGSGALLSLGGLLLAIHFSASMPVLLLASGAGPLIGLIANGLVGLGQMRSLLIPRWKLVNRQVSLGLLKLGLLFFVLQLAVAVAYQSDNVVIAAIMGAAAVTSYAAPMRLFMVGPMVLGFAMVPLWAAFAESISRGDIPWIKKALPLAIAAGLVFDGLFALAVLVAAPWVLPRWLGPDVPVSRALLIGLALWCFFNGLGGPLSAFFNGMGIVRFQVICAIGMMVSNLAASILLVHRIGVAGAIYGTLIAQVLFVFVPSLVYLRIKWPQLGQARVEQGHD
jgi:O-antigen/teichoic acid export membrane protein